MCTVQSNRTLETDPKPTDLHPVALFVLEKTLQTTELRLCHVDARRIALANVFEIFDAAYAKVEVDVIEVVRQIGLVQERLQATEIVRTVADVKSRHARSSLVPDCYTATVISNRTAPRRWNRRRAQSHLLSDDNDVAVGDKRNGRKAGLAGDVIRLQYTGTQNTSWTLGLPYEKLKTDRCYCFP